MAFRKIEAGLVNSNVDLFIGKTGTIFYDNDVGDFRISDGRTPGGIPLSFGGGGGGSYILPTATTSVKGGVKIDGTTITIANQIISVGTVPYSNLSGTPTIPTNTNQLTNGAGFITSSALSTYALSADIPTNTNQLTNGAGFITSSALTGYATQSYVTSRGYLTSVSWNDIGSKPSFSSVATSGSYIDLTNKPTIPTDISQLADSQGLLGQGGGGTTYVQNPFSFSIAGDDSTLREITDQNTVQFRGAGNITVTTNTDGVITITGPDLTSYATQSYVTSQGYITSSVLSPYALSADIPTNTNQLTNGAGYITSSALTGYATESYVTTRGYLTSVSWNDLTDKPNLAGTYSWNIAADDSTQIEISAGNLVKLVGAQGITTTSNADGQITITGPDLSSYATQSYVTTALANAGVTISLTAPSGLSNGALWYNSTALELYVRYQDQWVTASSSFSGNYNDLTNKPTNVSQFSNDAGYVNADQVYAMILEMSS